MLEVWQKAHPHAINLLAKVARLFYEEEPFLVCEVLGVRRNGSVAFWSCLRKLYDRFRAVPTVKADGCGLRLNKKSRPLATSSQEHQGTAFPLFLRLCIVISYAGVATV